ncbi:hypothetical protein M0R45_017052 [Rubus argutus]|uniref:MBD domain-containing protein n=1 Tax=Rubus argutus TaxID=59490 RepID=A0AAW1XUF8_RUBAR
MMGKILMHNVNLQMQSSRRSSSFTLPDGWEIEEKPRNNCPGHIDKYYIEPGTRKRFRSLISVERYLTEENEHTPLQALIPAQNNHSEHSSFPKKSISGETGRPSELNIGSPPTKVNWVLAGPGGNMWSPFMDDSRVADSVKQKWSEIFKSSIYDGNIKAPGS